MSFSINDSHAVEVANEMVALLTLCQQLQSEKDGIERPIPAMKIILPSVSVRRAGTSYSCADCYR